MAQTLIPDAEAPSVVPDSDELYEIVNGERRELPPTGAYDVYIASELQGFLHAFAREKSLGRAVTEMLFALRTHPKLQRRPDVAFVSFDRWPADRRVPRESAWDVVPDLVVEVISKSNFADEIPERVREYFEAGVRLVWVIFPSEAVVYAYESPVSIRVLTRDAEVSADPVLPGFRLRLAELLDEAEVPSAS